MSETMTMSVTQARAALESTRGMSNEDIEFAQRVVNDFYAQKPRKACAACGCMIWSEHNGGVWACDRCDRGPDVTAEEFRAAEAARRRAADEHLRAVDAAAPKPRDVLRERLTALAEARAAVAKAEAALPTARAAVSAAQERHDTAVEVAERSNVDAAEGLAAAIFEGRKPTDPARAAAVARLELSAAVDGLVAAKNATVITNGRIESARSAVGYVTDNARKAARSVIASERLEDLIGDAVEARAAYIDALGSLAWLVQQHAVPDGDSRVRQLVADGNTPPSAWPEAKIAGTKVMQDAFESLMSDPAAVI